MQIFLYVTVTMAALACIVGFLSILAPTRVEYTETVDIGARPEDVFDDVRFQERLMRWSAWPKETGSLCATDCTGSEDGADGAVGCRTVFYSKGKRFGHQEVVRVEPNRVVALTLESKGPPHTPLLTFYFEPIEDDRTRVKMHFINELPRPFNAIWKFAGLTNWTRKMHRKDLEGLRVFSEPPHRDSSGRIVGRPPEGPNPYEHSNEQVAQSSL